MNQRKTTKIAGCLATLIAIASLVGHLQAAEEKDNPIKEVMKTLHKAPQGVDATCKKASEGKASADELKKLVAGYKKMVAAKPPKGDDASWKEKTAKLLTAAEGLEKGGTDALAKYKEAVNCKACHTVHKPD
jgi:nitrate/TMAO reductase-like tetraheme cytochrome c subunit